MRSFRVPRSSSAASSRRRRLGETFKCLLAWQIKSKEGLTLPLSSRLICFGSTSRARARGPCLMPAAIRAALRRLPNSCASVTSASRRTIPGYARVRNALKAHFIVD
jgi:hypothetical protein